MSRQDAAHRRVHDLERKFAEMQLAKPRHRQRIKRQTGSEQVVTQLKPADRSFAPSIRRAATQLAAELQQPKIDVDVRAVALLDTMLQHMRAKLGEEASQVVALKRSETLTPDLMASAIRLRYPSTIDEALLMTEKTEQ